MRLHTVNVRRGSPDVQDQKLNSHSKLNCITACMQAVNAGADEALMLDPHGFVATCNSTHFFIVRRGEVWTSTGQYCIPGITRGNMMRVCDDNGIPVFEKHSRSMMSMAPMKPSSPAPSPASCPCARSMAARSPPHVSRGMERRRSHLAQAVRAYKALCAAKARAASDALVFLAAALLIELTPGPNMAWLAVLGAARGRTAALAAVAGVALGPALLVPPPWFTTLLGTLPGLFEALRWAGRSISSILPGMPGAIHPLSWTRSRATIGGSSARGPSAMYSMPRHISSMLRCCRNSSSVTVLTRPALPPDCLFVAVATISPRRDRPSFRKLRRFVASHQSPFAKLSALRIAVAALPWFFYATNQGSHVTKTSPSPCGRARAISRPP